MIYSLLLYVFGSGDGGGGGGGTVSGWLSERLNLGGSEKLRSFFNLASQSERWST